MTNAPNEGARRLHVCPLDHLDATLTSSASSHLISVMGPADMIARRSEFAPGRHLQIAVNDIAEPREGYILAEASHIREVTQFVLSWRDDDTADGDLCLHCWAGVSRSTAAALIALCALNLDVDEAEIAQALYSAAPFINPNPRLIDLGDNVLGRKGRLVRAVRSLPQPEMVSLGRPFSLPAFWGRN